MSRPETRSMSLGRGNSLRLFQNNPNSTPLNHHDQSSASPTNFSPYSAHIGSGVTPVMNMQEGTAVSTPQHLELTLQIEKLKMEQAALEAERHREEAERQRLHELNLREMEEERRQRDRDHELELARMKSHDEDRRRVEDADRRQNQWRCESFPTFNEEKDCIDSFLEGFERRARLASQDQQQWVTWLGQVMCKGKVGDVYARCIKDPDVTYQDIKDALFSHFNLRPEEYRRHFRNLRPEPKEMPIQFSKRLHRQFDKWMEAEKVNSMEDMKNLMLVEQIMKCYNPDERVYVRQSRATEWDEVVSSLQAYVEARVYNPLAKKKVLNGSNGSNQNVSTGEESPQASNHRRPFNKFANITCYKCNSKGHKATSCPTPGLFSSTLKSRQHNIIHTTDLNLKETYNMPLKEGYVEGKKCTVLRDTGCGCVVVQRKLVPENQIKSTTQKLVMIDGQVKEFPTAKVKVQSPYLSAEIDVVVMDSPVYPCIIGNVDGASGPQLSEKDPVKNSKVVGAGRQVPPRQSKKACSSDTLSLPVVPAIPVEAREDLCLKDDVTLPSSDRACLPRVEKSVLQRSTEPCSKVQEKPVESPVQVLKTGEKRTERNKTPGSILQDTPEQPAAAVVTRSQEEAEKQVPKTKPLITIDSIKKMNRNELIDAQEKDPSLLKARENAKKENVLDHRYGQSKFFYDNGLLMRSYEENEEPGHLFSQIVLPQCMRQDVLKLAHEGLLSGHLAAAKTFSRIIPHFYWPAMHGDVKRHCQSCDTCQRTIPRGKVYPVPLGNVPVVGEPFQRIGIDLMGPLEKTTSNKKYVLVCACYATRYPDAIALSNITAESVAEALISLFCRYGCVKVIHSDKGSQFTSGMWAEVCRLLNVKQSFSTAWHPEANGLTEKMVGNLKQMIRRMCIERPKDWDRYLDPVLFAYREIPNSSTHFSPFELLYGRTIRGPMAILKESFEEDEVPEDIMTSYEYVFNLRNRLEDTCKIAQENLEKSKAVYKKYYDRKTKEREFSEGDKNLLLLPSSNSKLTMQWRGPYNIVSRVGTCNYRINLDGKEKTFHANMMKLYVTRQGQVSSTAMNKPVPGTSKESCQSTVDEQPCSSSSSKGCSFVLAAAAVVHEDDTSDSIPTFDPSPHKKSFDINPDLKADQKKDIENLVGEFSDRLSPLPGLTDLETHDVELTSSKPVRSKCYHTPYAMRKVIDEEIEKMVQLDVIEPSKSSYAAPVVLVKKVDQSFRFCCDYRGLNAVTKFHAEPVPDQNHLFMKLQGAKYLSRVDLCKAFWQIKIPEADRHKTAFITHSGLWQWKVMPFGMINSGATFSKMMKKLLAGIPDAHHYMDDVIIGSQTWEEHLATLHQIFTRLRQHNLTAKPEKCQFGYSKLEFLGHVVGQGILQTDPTKVEKVLNIKKPVCKKTLRSFLGMIGYYSKFIPSYATTCAPLTDALKTGQPIKLNWTQPMQESYEKLKQALSSSPILHLPDFSKTFYLRTDASDVGVAGCLFQNDKEQLFPVEFISKKLNKAEQRYSVTERECLALVWSIQKLQPYLYGTHFILETDHAALQYMNRAKLENARVMRWALLLQQYRFTIKAIKGSENFGADFFSRCLPC